MATACSICGRPADRFRDAVRVVGMRVEVVCRRCASGAEEERTVRPVGATQRSAHETARLPERARRPEAFGLVLLLLVAVASTGIALVVRARRASSGTTVTAAPPRQTPRVASVADGDQSNFDVPPPAGLAAVLQGSWTHPLPGPFRDLPTHEQRRFGAYRGREHYRNRYCGSGHCGVDLGYNVGLPVMAARDGVVERAVRNPTEVEGKYIKLRHAGGLRTYYMHLDEIAPELAEGSAVRAGQIIGTLGRTGIKTAEPHLHFMISFELKGKELFIDPEPLMARADLVEVDQVPLWAKK